MFGNGYGLLSLRILGRFFKSTKGESVLVGISSTNWESMPNYGILLLAKWQQFSTRIAAGIRLYRMFHQLGWPQRYGPYLAKGQLALFHYDYLNSLPMLSPLFDTVVHEMAGRGICWNRCVCHWCGDMYNESLFVGAGLLFHKNYGGRAKWNWTRALPITILC